MTDLERNNMRWQDEKALNWFTRETGRGPKKITHTRLAEKLLCSRHTARRIVDRLVRAGLLRVDRTGKRGGYVYEAVKQNAIVSEYREAG